MTSLKDRILTTKVARAMMSPLAIVATGTGASVGIVAGGGGTGSIIGGIIGGVLGWLTRVGLAIPGGPSKSSIDPFTLSEPWRRLTKDALSAKSQFNDAVRRTKSGPVKERLSLIGDRLDDSIVEVWATAQAGHDFADAYSRVDAKTARRDLDAILSQYPQGERTPTTEATIQSLEAQLGTAQRMYDLIVATQAKLQLLNARLDESVAASIELSVGVHQPEEFSVVAGAVASITDELGALRGALTETNSPTPGFNPADFEPAEADQTQSTIDPGVAAPPAAEPKPKPSTG